MKLRQLISYLTAIQSALDEDATVALEIDNSDDDGPRWVTSDSMAVTILQDGTIYLSGIRNSEDRETL